MEYILYLAVVVSIYSILAAALDLLAGHTGLLSIAQAAFYGLGAYSSALLIIKAGAPFLLGIVAGIIVASALSLLVSLPSLRLVDDYFVIATFAFQVIVFSIFNNWIGLTNGPTGIPAIPSPSIFGFAINSNVSFLVLAGLCAVVANVIVRRLTIGPFGRVLHAIREDEILAKSLGKNTVRVKIITVLVSSALAAMAGSLYAQFISYIDPNSFTVMESILIISMVIIGGAGSRWGPLVGAVVLVSLPAFLQFIGLPNSIAADLRQIAYGGLLVIMMVMRPQGLVGNYKFGGR